MAAAKKRTTTAKNKRPAVKDTATSKAPKAFTKAELLAEYEQRRLVHERTRDKLHTTLVQLIADLGTDHRVRPVPLIQADVKTFDSFYEKAVKKRTAGTVQSVEDCFLQITDVARARIICQTADDRERLQRMLDRDDVAGLFASRGSAEIHDGSTNDRGYRALHYDLRLDVPHGTGSVPVDCELQLCTALQFAWGMYTHGDVYKSATANPLFKELMRDLSDALAVADAMAARLIAALDRPTDA